MKIVSYILVVMAAVSIQAAEEFDFIDSQPTYIARIEASSPMARIPSVSCLYHGCALLCKDGFCQLPENELRTFFSIIITPRVQFVRKDSITHMKRVKGLPCKWYNATLHFENALNDKKIYYRWTIEELNAKKMPLRLPDDASVVFEIPPSFVHKLEAPQLTGPYAIKLPSLVLKKTVTNEQLEKALVEVAAQAPERNRNCTKPIDFWRKEGKTILKKQVQ